MREQRRHKYNSDNKDVSNICLDLSLIAFVNHLSLHVVVINNYIGRALIRHGIVLGQVAQSNRPRLCLALRDQTEYQRANQVDNCRQEEHNVPLGLCLEKKININFQYST
jgi:hypothetical protein